MTPKRKEQIKSQLLLVAVLAGVIGYGWLTSWVLEPRLTLPSTVFSGSAWKVDGQAVDFVAVRSRFPNESDEIALALSTIENDVVALGGLTQSLTLVINFDEPFRYLVSDSRVELGSKVAMSEGQLAKAVIKAWLQQRASEEITSSLLRMDVVSDLLLSMLQGRMGLVSPGDHERLEISQPRNWLSFAASFSSSCGAPWRSMELRDLCGSSMAVNPQSFRLLLDSVFWNVYQSVPKLSRMDFMVGWLASLQSHKSSITKQRALPSNLSDEKKWLASEIAVLFPIQTISVAREKSELAFNQAIHKARLSEADALFVDYIFHSDRDVQSRVFESSKNRKNAVAAIENADGLRLIRGKVEVDQTELRNVQTRMLVWENCRAPRLDEVLNEKLKNERFLFVQNCDDKTSAVYGSLIDDGIEAFAAVNQSARFVLLRREALQLAANRAPLNPLMNLTDLMKKGSAKSLELLGLERASLRKDIQAYRVLGAIEAVEWFRSEPAAIPKPITLNLGTGS